MNSTEDSKPPSPWVLRAVAWCASVAALTANALHEGSVIKPPSSGLDGTFLWVGLGFLALPFLRTIKIGKLVELEREVEKTKETVREVRDDLHQSLSLLAATLSASASARATVHNVV